MYITYRQTDNKATTNSRAILYLILVNIFNHLVSNLSAEGNVVAIKWAILILILLIQQTIRHPFDIEGRGKAQDIIYLITYNLMEDVYIRVHENLTLR